MSPSLGVHVTLVWHLRRAAPPRLGEARTKANAYSLLWDARHSRVRAVCEWVCVRMRASRARMPFHVRAHAQIFSRARTHARTITQAPNTHARADMHARSTCGPTISSSLSSAFCCTLLREPWAAWRAARDRRPDARHMMCSIFGAPPSAPTPPSALPRAHRPLHLRPRTRTTTRPRTRTRTRTRTTTTTMSFLPAPGRGLAAPHTTRHVLTWRWAAAAAALQHGAHRRERPSGHRGEQRSADGNGP